MAPPSRSENSAVIRWPIADTLSREPYRFDFFQAVRLLARMAPGRQVVGRFSHPATEVVRFGANPLVAFPASQIQSLEDSPGAPPLMRVNFMGLTGPLGMLPLVYSQLVLERIRARDTSMRDFFDLFNHRAISMFYLAWEKHRFSVPYERGERDRFSRHVLALIGLATPGLQDCQEVPDDSLLFYGGLISAHTRSAAALQQILADYFSVPVEIEQFVGAWYPVEIESQCSLGEEGRDSERLGFGTVVGDEIFDQQSRIRIHLGPLTTAQYLDFLPGGSAHRNVRALTLFFAGGEYDVELRLILRRDQVPRCELVQESGLGPRLGWTSWIKSADFERDAGETILEL